VVLENVSEGITKQDAESDETGELVQFLGDDNLS
jgi:hypothetical protein